MKRCYTSAITEIMLQMLCINISKKITSIFTLPSSRLDSTGLLYRPNMNVCNLLFARLFIDCYVWPYSYPSKSIMCWLQPALVHIHALIFQPLVKGQRGRSYTFSRIFCAKELLLFPFLMQWFKQVMYICITPFFLFVTHYFKLRWTCEFVKNFCHVEYWEVWSTSHSFACTLRLQLFEQKLFKQFCLQQCHFPLSAQNLPRRPKP